MRIAVALPLSYRRKLDERGVEDVAVLAAFNRGNGVHHKGATTTAIFVYARERWADDEMALRTLEHVYREAWRAIKLLRMEGLVTQPVPRPVSSNWQPRGHSRSMDPAKPALTPHFGRVGLRLEEVPAPA